MKLRGSYTVEAAFVMGMLLLAVTQGVLWTYRLKDQVVGAMILEEAVEWVRYDEETPLGENLQKGLEILGFGVRIADEGTYLEGTVEKNGQKRELSMKRYEPEEFLRKVSMIEEGMEHGNSVSAGD